MARIVHNLQARTAGHFHVYTDLDFWDARRILKDIATVRRNFGETPPGDRYPTQVLSSDASRARRREIEKRLAKAVASPPRHLIVEGIINHGRFQFDRNLYYPERWSTERAIFFTRKRLPRNQPVIESAYKWVEVKAHGDLIIIEQRHGQRPRGRDREGDEIQRWGPACI